jgi:hypothetical protein
LAELNQKLDKKYDELRTWYAHEEKAIRRKHTIYNNRNSTQNSDVHLLSPVAEESPSVQKKTKVSVLETEVFNVGVDISSLENGSESVDMICLISVNNLLSSHTTEFKNIDWDGAIQDGEKCTEILSKKFNDQTDIDIKISVLKEISENCKIRNYQEVEGDLYEKNQQKTRNLKDMCTLMRMKNPNGWIGFLKIGDYGICISCSKMTEEDHMWIFDPQGGQERGRSVLIKFKSESDFFIYIKGRLTRNKIQTRAYRMFIFTK